MTSVLMLTCQKIGATTGSGVVTTELARRLAQRGHHVTLMHGVDEELDAVPAGLIHPKIRLVPIEFGSSLTAAIPFPIVGMSNEMPYRSMRFSELRAGYLAAYCDVWTREIASTIAECAPQVIHVHHLWLLVHLVRKLTKLPLVVSLHGTELHRAEDVPHIRELILPTLRSVDRLIALSQGMVDEACRVFAVDQSRFSVLGNGFNADLFGPMPVVREHCRWTRLRNLPTRTRLISSAGKFAHWKGLPYLIQAAHQLSADVHLAIAGTGPLPERQMLARRVSELGLESSVTFLGHLSSEQLAELLNLTDVFVLPSYHEPFGLVLLEALACGCRTVFANQGGPAEFVPQELLLHGYASRVDGLRSNPPGPDDAASYVADLQRAISSQLTYDRAIAIRRRISSTVEHLNWDRYVVRLERVYRDTCRDPQGPAV